MSGLLGRFSLLESVAAMPVWMAGAIAALIVVACLLAFNGTGRERMLGGVGLILLGVGIIWILLDGSARRDLAIERRALDGRANELMVRAVMPGSALACLNGMAGEAVEACVLEGAVCNAGSDGRRYVLRLSATHIVGRCRRVCPSGFELHGRTGQLRHSAELDRYGIVAHVLAARDACSADHCPIFALLNDASRVSTNLAEQRV